MNSKRVLLVGGIFVLGALLTWSLLKDSGTTPAAATSPREGVLPVPASVRLKSIKALNPLPLPVKCVDPYDLALTSPPSLGHTEKILADDATEVSARKEAQKRWETLTRLPPYDPAYALATQELREIAREAIARWDRGSNALEFRRFGLLAAERLNYFEGLGSEMWNYATAAAKAEPAMTTEKCAVRELLRAAETSPRAAAAYAKKIIEMSPNTRESAQAHFQLAKIYSKDSRKAAFAFMNFMEAAKSDERQTRYLARRGAYTVACVSANQEHIESAITALLGDDLLKPAERPKLLLERANSCFLRKQYEKALSDCKKIRSEFPASGQAAPAATLEEKVKAAVFGALGQ